MFNPDSEQKLTTICLPSIVITETVPKRNQCLNSIKNKNKKNLLPT